MHFRDLNDTVRTEMVREIRSDIARRALYQSGRLSVRGRADWPDLLVDAAESGTTETLAAELRKSGRLATAEISHRNGKPYTKAVPSNAAETLAEGEFNHFYMRAICAIALSRGQADVAVYRAKGVTTPRAESVSLVGSSIDAQALLDDLRAHTGVDGALGIPPGPNSGLSVHLLAVEPPIAESNYQAS